MVAQSKPFSGQPVHPAGGDDMRIEPKQALASLFVVSPHTNPVHEYRFELTDTASSVVVVAAVLVVDAAKVDNVPEVVGAAADWAAEELHPATMSTAPSTT